MKKFDFVRIYDDSFGFRKPYSNIEFVVSNNVFKRFINAWSVIEEDERFADTKAADRRVVFRPQNYEQFKKYLQETKIDETLGDVKVYHDFPVTNENSPSPKDLGEEGFEVLLALAKEMLYDDTKKRDEKTENHLKRTFVNETNKIHRQMLAEHSEKVQPQQKQ